MERMCVFRHHCHVSVRELSVSWSSRIFKSFGIQDHTRGELVTRCCTTTTLTSGLRSFIPCGWTGWFGTQLERKEIQVISDKMIFNLQITNLIWALSSEFMIICKFILDRNNISSNIKKERKREYFIYITFLYKDTKKNNNK